MIKFTRSLLADLSRAGVNAESPAQDSALTESHRLLGWRNLLLLFTAVLSSGLIFCVWKTGAVPQILFGHDIIFFLDGAWKWQWGVLPHVDYYSPASALTFLLPAIGAAWSGNMVDAFPAAICFFALCALPLSLYATFTRLRPFAAAAASLVIIAACLAPHELRFGSDDWSYSAFYNRWGYALFCIGLVVVTVRPQGQGRWLEMLDGIVAGLAGGLLIFLKISYGLLALAVFLAFIPIVERRVLYYAGAGAALAVVVTLFGALLRWDFVSFARDMSLAAHARKDLGLGSLAEWALTLWPDLVVLALLIGLWCLSGIRYRRLRVFPRVLYGGLLFGCFAISAAAILMSNSPLGVLRESPVLCIAGLIVWSGIIYECWTCRDKSELPWKSLRLPILAVASLLMLLIVAEVFCRNVGGIASAAKWERESRTFPARQVVREGPLKGLQIRFFGGEPPLPTSYLGKIEDGLTLLETTGNADKTVVCLDFTNPFNLVRGIKPSRTAPTVWQLNFVYSMKAAPQPEKVFGAEDVVMWPKIFGDGYPENQDALRHHYGAYLDEHYCWAGGNEQWDLYVPKDQYTGRPLTLPMRKSL